MFHDSGSEIGLPADSIGQRSKTKRGILDTIRTFSTECYTFRSDERTWFFPTPDQSDTHSVPR